MWNLIVSFIIGSSFEIHLKGMLLFYSDNSEMEHFLAQKV